MTWWRVPPRSRSGPLFQHVAASGQVRFFALGDVGLGEASQMAVAAAMERRCQHVPELTGILLLGDNFYPKGVRSVEDPQWQSKFERPYGSPCLARVPVYAVFGNHDIQGNADAQILYGQQNRRWVMPSRFYRVDFGTLLEVVALDSEFFDVCGISSLCVFDFLRAALSSSPAPRWRLVMAHRPLTSAAATQSDYLSYVLGAVMRPLVCRAGDVYLSGHAHHLEHRQLDGCRTQFVVAGGGGGLLHPIRRNERESRFVASQHGFAELLFGDTEASLTFWSTTDDRLYAYDFEPLPASPP